MTHAVLVQEKVAALNVDAYNRPCVSASDIDNGYVFQLATKSSTAGESEAWVATIPASGAGLQNLWMAYEPEIVTVLSGTKEYKGINPDPRDFYTVAGKMFSAFRPVLGDLLKITGDGLTTGAGAESAYAVATNNDFKLNWAAAAVSGLSLKYLATDYISLADGSIGTQRVVAYKFEVVAVA